MKRLFALLLCLLLVVLPAAAYADGGSVLQVYGSRQNEKSLDILLYTKDTQYFSTENYSVTYNGTQLPVSRLLPLSTSDEYGTSWVIIAEPAAYESISAMAESLIETLISGLGARDNAAVINAVTGEMTEFVRDKTTLMPFVRTALGGRGDARIYDALRLALTTFTDNMALNRHKCILLITEGIDHSSMYTLSEARDEAARQSATIYTVGITRNVSTYAEAFKEVSSLSRATASGAAFSFDDFPAAAAEEAINRIRDQEKNNFVLTADLSPLTADSASEANIELTYTGSGGNQQYAETLENVKIDLAAVTAHEHIWEEATCYRPTTCTICGETEGEPVEHSFGSDGLCIWCGTEQEGIMTWVRNNVMICAAAGALLLLLLILLIVLVSGNRKRKASKGARGKAASDTGEDTGIVTVELTNKASGEKHRGRIRNSTLKAGRTAELSLTGDASISREHMEFVWQNGILYLQDTNATNGTWINGKRLQGAVALHQSDVIHAGDSDFIVNWHSNI